MAKLDVDVPGAEVDNIQVAWRLALPHCPDL
jgi:hypothetical protein